MQKTRMSKEALIKFFSMFADGSIRGIYYETYVNGFKEIDWSWMSKPLEWKRESDNSSDPIDFAGSGDGYEIGCKECEEEEK